MYVIYSIPDNMAESTEKLRATLHELERRRREILRRLWGRDELAVGTVSWVERSCGRAGCHCAEGQRHRQLQFLSKAGNGRRRCQIIRKADHGRLLRASARYKAIRAYARDLKAIQDEEAEILMALMEARQITYG
jgi:hypothetical protein